MSHQFSRQGHESLPKREAFNAPKLELPRFQLFSTQEPQRTYERTISTPHASKHTPNPTTLRPAPKGELPSLCPPDYMAPASNSKLAPESQSTYFTPSPQPVPRTWEPVHLDDQPSLLQRITPLHMGVALIMVIVFMVMTSGPPKVRNTPARLSALPVAGGGNVNSLSEVTPPNRSDVQVTPANKQSSATPTAPPMKEPPMDGIPSPAASAKLALTISGGGSEATTDTIIFDGIPSPAAAAKLGPQTLPYRPSDGVTLPRSSTERDAHAMDTYYGSGSDTLPLEEPSAPVLTPAGAAAAAERSVTLGSIGSQSATPAVPSAGQVWAF